MVQCSSMTLLISETGELDVMTSIRLNCVKYLKGEVVVTPDLHLMGLLFMTLLKFTSDVKKTRHVLFWRPEQRYKTIKGHPLDSGKMCLCTNSSFQLTHIKTTYTQKKKTSQKDLWVLQAFKGIKMDRISRVETGGTFLFCHPQCLSIPSETQLPGQNFSLHHTILTDIAVAKLGLWSFFRLVFFFVIDITNNGTIPLQLANVIRF